MVHALNDAHRVLVQHGTMIDVRPYSIDVPLEIISRGGSESAGMIDMSPDIELDKAADRAIVTGLSENLFQEVSKEWFYFAYYWRTFRDMKVDLDEYWKDEVIIPDEVFKRAWLLLKTRQPERQIRVGIKMKLAKYEKLR